MSDFLIKIKAQVKERVQHIQIDALPQKNTVDFCRIFQTGSAPVIIAEVKFASPSRGRIYAGTLSHTDIAEDYLENGAAALSILTEPTYFHGQSHYLSEVRSTLPQAPLLLKDFVLSKVQVDQALLLGANAILFIVAFLDKQLLVELYHYALSLGLTPLIEVHNQRELEVALQLNPKMIGINNRNLHTLQVDLNTAKELIQLIPKGTYTICESGIQNKPQLQAMQKLGFHGFLIGASLMSDVNPGKALNNLLSGGNDAC